jgi:glycosyltransferase involved in cell wall biosynthesis
MATVSVFVPCYNYGAFLQECTESILSQQGVDVRVLIIDDASSDATQQVGTALARQDSRVEYRRHPVNKGHIATFNEGLRWATGEYTMLLSADDLLTPGALQRAAQVMEAHPEIGLVFGRALPFSTHGRRPVPRTRMPVEWEVLDGLEWFRGRCRVAENSIAAAAVIVRTSLQHQLGGYLPNLPHSGDMEMWLRFALHAPLARITNADQAYFRVHAESMQYSRFASPLARLEQRKAGFDEVFRNYGDRIPDLERMQSLVKRALATDALWSICRAAYRRELGTTPVSELLDFAVRTRQGNEASPGNASSRIRLGRDLSRLIGPFLDGAWRWPRGWLKPRAARAADSLTSRWN